MTTILITIQGTGILNWFHVLFEDTNVQTNCRYDVEELCPMN